MRSIGIALCSLLLFSATATGQNVTFHKDVLPILQAKCQSCHRPGEIAPMSFLTYQSTRPWAKAIKAAVMARVMPPGGLDPQYGEFVDNFTLSQSEIDTIAKWADSDAIAGDVTDAPPPVQWVEGWRSKPDVVIDVPPFEVPAKGWVENMIMVLPSPFKKDTWVTSIEIRPGVPAAMHHAGVRFSPHFEGMKYGQFYWSDIKRDEFGAHIAGQPTPRRVTFCNDDHSKVCPAPEADTIPDGVVAGFEGFYRPGAAPLDYAYYKTAYLVPANTDVVLSLHYTPIGKAVTDTTKIGFVVAKQEPDRQLIMRALKPRGINGWNDPRFRIPAGDPNWEPPPKDVIFNRDVELAVMSIHMHEHGKDMKYMLMYPDGKVEIILNQPKYNFNWQMTYNLEKTLKIPKGTKMRVISHFDNSVNNKFARGPIKDVFGGEQSWEEMDAPWIGLVLDRGVDAKTVYTENPGNGATFWSQAPNP
jgi:Copper type II ascorbate-dependent monooxygenase, C-terminal domain